ncbi:hypothetical protein BU17DRAFT_39852 [Hysterangium stoloniferum]|nr:hypothetical protein BU17DRAFT_39852 [Hysterangium stoloniferum]
MHRKPLRMDAQDGPWSVSVAENPHDSKTYTIYIQTPTHHLTLTRTASEVAELHTKLADVHASPELPPLPLTEPPTKRRSSFLHTLSRLANTTPKPAVQPRSSLQYPTPSVSPIKEPDDPFTNPLSAPSAAATSLASYLTAVSNSPSIRTARPWRRFVRVRTDDLESVRIERAIKRVRSDLAIHHPAPAPAAQSLMSQLLDSQHVVESDVESVPSIKEEDEPEGDADPDVEAEENVDDAELRANAKIAELLAAGETVEEQRPALEPVADFLPTPAPSPPSPSPPPPPHRIPRSASADPDKASRIARTAWLPSEPTPSPSPRPPKRTTIDDFDMLRVLGKGCAGKVLLVRHRASTSLYALKAITKRHVLAHQELQHTLTEQAVLKRMAHEARDPFVVKLWWSFHDKENLFLVMDFHPGGDLATQLARWGRLGRDRARFYAAEIVEGVDGLHAAGVIYRDLKPENILIGADGHIVLTDFGLSKEFPRRPTLASSPSPEFYSSTPGTPTPSTATAHWMHDAGGAGAGWVGGKDSTSTFCGTAEYLAPEVIQGLPYSYEVDWWSFGTMLYEMLTGITPFWANNHSDMYVRVLQDELQFPEDKAMDQDTKSLIRGLLQRNPALRMSEPRIKRHPYFSMIDWSHVYYKRYIPPYIPPIDPSNASDTQNFDEAFLDMDPTIEDRDEVDESSPERQVQVPEEGDDEKDLFDGYSFKGRNSVIIDDELIIGEEEKEEETAAELEEAPTPPTEDLSTPETVSTPQSEPVLTPEVELLEPEAESKVEPEVQVEDEQEAPVTPTSPSPPTPTPAPPAPIPTSTSLPSTSAPAPPTKTAFRSLDPSRPTKAVTIAPPASHPRRREKSGVLALDRARNADMELDGSVTEREEEEDDWDFVETPGGEDRNGAKGTSLFARGVVDRYRLAVFRKTSGNVSGGRSFSGASSTFGAVESDVGSPESGEKKRGRLGKGKGKFLRARSPPAGGVFGSGMGNRSVSSGTIVSSNSGATMQSQSLRSKESTTSMGSPSGSASSDAEDVPGGTTATGRKLKKMKRYKEGAEKVLSLFGSPRQERTQAQS